MEIRSFEWRYIGWLAMVAVLALVIAACGGGSSSSSSSTGGGEPAETEGSESKEGAAEEGAESSGGVDLAALEKSVNEHIKYGPIGPTVPIEKPVPANTNTVFINCGAPACVSFEKAYNEAAGVLGIEVENITVEPTPASIQSGFSEAVRRKPAAVITSGFAIEQYPKQAKELNELEIPIISNTGTDPSTYNPKEGVTLQLQETDEVSEAAELMADKALVDAGGEGEFVAVNLSGYPSVAIQVKAFEEHLKAECPECTVNHLDIQPTSLGKDAPTIVANYVRSHSGIKGIYFGYDGIALGLSAAFKSAGITPPATYAWAPDEPGVQELQNEELTAGVPLGYPETGWQFADAVARFVTGGNIKDSKPVGPYVLWSKQFENVPSNPKDLFANPNYKKEFEKLWGK
jgi:ribose transport system substrate-binding protein